MFLSVRKLTASDVHFVIISSIPFPGSNTGETHLAYAPQTALNQSAVNHSETAVTRGGGAG